MHIASIPYKYFATTRTYTNQYIRIYCSGEINSVTSSFFFIITFYFYFRSVGFDVSTDLKRTQNQIIPRVESWRIKFDYLCSFEVCVCVAREAPGDQRVEMTHIKSTPRETLADSRGTGSAER